MQTKIYQGCWLVVNKILRYTKEQKKFIEDNVKGRGNKELTDLFNKEFETNFSVEKIKSYKYNHKLSSGLTGRFEKGHESWNKGKKCPQIKNKTSFKKGNVPVNHRPVGSVRVSASGYRYTKIEEPDKWELTHRLIWEQHHGEIRKDQCVIFLNGDKSNLDVTNLAVIERRDLVTLNQKGLITDDRETTRSGVGIVKIENKIRDLEKGKKYEREEKNMRERWTRDEDRELVGQHAVHRLPYWQIAENLGRTGAACAMRMRNFSVSYYIDLIKEYVVGME